MFLPKRTATNPETIHPTLISRTAKPTATNPSAIVSQPSGWDKPRRERPGSSIHGRATETTPMTAAHTAGLMTTTATYRV